MFYHISRVCFMPFHVGYHKHCHYQSVPDRSILLWFLLFAEEGQSFWLCAFCSHYLTNKTTCELKSNPSIIRRLQRHIPLTALALGCDDPAGSGKRRGRGSAESRANERGRVCSRKSGRLKDKDDSLSFGESAKKKKAEVSRPHSARLTPGGGGSSNASVRWFIIPSFLRSGVKRG